MQKLKVITYMPSPPPQQQGTHLPSPLLCSCLAAAPIRTVMGTSQTMEAVAQACSLHGASVAGCQQCAAGWRSCTNPLAVLSRLCLASPEISQCRCVCMCLWRCIVMSPLVAWEQ